MSSIEKFERLLRVWNEQNQSGQDVTSTIIKLAEIIEKENEVFLKKNPDPFDYRFTCRFLGSILNRLINILIANKVFLKKIVKVYCQQDILELNIASCRLLLGVLPEVDTLVFDKEAFTYRLFQWAEYAPKPLQSYATGILASAMHFQNSSGIYNEKNAYFVPLMLRRLHALSEKHLKPKKVDGHVHKSSPQKSKKRKLDEDKHDSPCPETKLKCPNSNLKVSPVKANNLNDVPSRKWQFKQHYVIMFYQIHPFTAFIEQKLILDYLSSVCRCKNLLKLIVGEKALPLILKYIDLRQNTDLRLALEALRCLSSLFCHKTIAVEFVNTGSLQLLLKMPFPSVAVTGVSCCLYHLAMFEEIMEKICFTWSSLIPELIFYALRLLRSCHSSSVWNISVFFEIGFQYQIILETFDHQEGLRKLFNSISALKLYNNEDPLKILANRRTTWLVLGALKSYFEAHLVLELDRLLSSSGRRDIFPKKKKPYEALDLCSERIDNCLKSWRELLSSNIVWKPVGKFMDLQGVQFLLMLINANTRVRYPERAYTNEHALSVLKVCSLTIPVQLLFCENVASSSSYKKNGFDVLLMAADDIYMQYAEMQRCALETIINCVCFKIPQDDSSKSTPKNELSIEECLNKFYECIKSRNGICILSDLICVEKHLLECDLIRALACQALSGLARSETIKQIISKLPLIADGQLLDFMKKYASGSNKKYVEFCKYGFQLIERVTGAKVTSSSVSSMLDIYNSDVVARTKIVYNKPELHHLIAEHLQSMGFHETVNTLKKELIENQICPMPAINSLVTSCNSNAITPDPKPSSSRLQKPHKRSGEYVLTPAFRKQASILPYAKSQKSISLDYIVTECLRKQHALCKNPKLDCPPFDLFVPHKCPELN